MKLKTANSATLKHGDTKLVNRFAWLPVAINGNIIWLESYQILRAYIGTTYTVLIEGKPANFIISKWMTLSKRVLM
jgi:hypothetical protein